MDKETVNYILEHFSNLLTEKEALALKHCNYLHTIDHKPAPETRKNLLEMGVLTEDPEALKLLNIGYENFRSKSAHRIVDENKEIQFFNNCPKCGKRARTPRAKICPHCFHNWHNQ